MSLSTNYTQRFKWNVSLVKIWDVQFKSTFVLFFEGHLQIHEACGIHAWIGSLSKSVLTIQKCPDDRNDLRTLTNVLQSFNTDTDVIQSHQHQPAKHKNIFFKLIMLRNLD